MNNFNFDLENTVDEDFFGTLKGKSSKLQQLFGEDSITKDEKQQSLKYQRPKATDLKHATSYDNADVATTSSASQASVTLMAKVVVAYKQGELVGKVGLALIQNPDQSCSLIIYKTKVHILATIKLGSDRNVLFKHTKYWQFYDEESIYWSFSFDSLEDEEEFKEKLEKNKLAFKENLESTRKDEILKPENMAQSGTDYDDLEIGTAKSRIKETKNSLIKRMAKMGKPLPTLSSSIQQTTTEFSDSSDTEVINTPLSLATKPAIAPRASKLTTIKSNQQLVPTTVEYNNASSANSNAIYPVNPMESQYMNMLLTEQRTQGSELRMNMNKLENKIEKVLDKLELFDRHDEGKEKRHKDDEILDLEEKLLMLKKENRKLKQSMEEKSSRHNEERNIKEILQEFKNDFKELNIDDDNNDLKVVLNELIRKLKRGHLEIKDNQDKVNVFAKKLNDLQSNLEAERLKTQNCEQQLKLQKQQEQLLQTKLQENEEKIKLYEQQINDLKQKLEEKSKEISENSADVLVKSIMNNLYTDIADKLDNSSIPNNDKILTLIAASIRQQTLKSLQQSTLKDN